MFNVTVLFLLLLCTITSAGEEAKKGCFHPSAAPLLAPTHRPLAAPLKWVPPLFPHQMVYEMRIMF